MLVALLTTLFVGLKLTGVIAWSWVWVLSPVWIATLCGVVLFALAVGQSIVSRVKWGRR